MRVSPVAISEWDSWGWLDPALGWLGGTGFRERFEREWLYGAFIAACLRLTGSFSGYIIIQQSLGVIAAICMWLTWRTLDGPLAETVYSRDRWHHHRSAHRRPLSFQSYRARARALDSARRNHGFHCVSPALSVSPAIADFVGTNPGPLPPSSLESSPCCSHMPFLSLSPTGSWRAQRPPCRFSLAFLAKPFRSKFDC